ncbi:MAG: hypothetical protein ACHP6H_03450, partial [Legionellales bacterium]
MGISYEKILRNRMTVFTALLLLYALYYPILLVGEGIYKNPHEFYSGALRETGFAIWFIFDLPLGIIWLFSDIDYHSGLLYQSIQVIMNVLYWGSFLYYVVFIKTISRKWLIGGFFAIIVIFVLSM